MKKRSENKKQNVNGRKMINENGKLDG